MQSWNLLPILFQMRLWCHYIEFLRLWCPPKVSLRDYDVITGDSCQKSGNPPKVSLRDYDVIIGDSLWKPGNPPSFIKRLWCHNRGFPAKNREVWKVSTTKFQKFQIAHLISSLIWKFQISNKWDLKQDVRFQLCIKPTGFLVVFQTEGRSDQSEQRFTKSVLMEATRSRWEKGIIYLDKCESCECVAAGDDTKLVSCFCG